MYGVYGDIIGAAENALKCFEETKELLEYPEVQADKAYYLHILSKYNGLKNISDKLSALKSALEEEKTATALLGEANTNDERSAIYEEISTLKRRALTLSESLSDALGCKHIIERAYCRFKLKEASAKVGYVFFSLIKQDLLSRGAYIEDENFVNANGGYVREISFIAKGTDVITRLTPLIGAHRVYVAQSGSEELCFAVTPAADVEELNESDLKIDLFHSRGAGGQNVNKVETAVRVTHIPSGLSVVCQDERSQLKNKRRALETIEKRLKERAEQAEKKRVEADICAQYAQKNTPISFDLATGTFTDTRLASFNKIPFPPTEAQFTGYINGLTAL